MLINVNTVNGYEVIDGIMHDMLRITLISIQNYNIFGFRNDIGSSLLIRSHLQ